jgi:sugar phosphate isomerase/epimerase
MSLDEGLIPYCTNLHPSPTIGDLMTQLERFAVPLARRLGQPFPVGLWLPRSALEDVTGHRALEFGRWLHHHGLECATMNAFPFGNFHAKRVKHDVYQPDWTTAQRSDYTCRVADFLVGLGPVDGTGSISTLPLGWKSPTNRTPIRTFFPMLLETVRHLAYLKDSTGMTIRLALEPEPGCLLERYSEIPSFFAKLWKFAGESTYSDDLQAVQEHVGVCVDVCHAAVMFEEIAESIRQIDQAGVRIVKVQLSSALEAAEPSRPEVRRALKPFVDDRYLHQTTALHPSGTFLFMDDLEGLPLDETSPVWMECPSWRIHYHVPIHTESFGPLRTTAASIKPTLEAINKLPYTPHLEVETYTWSVLPGTNGTDVESMVDGLECEIRQAQMLRSQVMSAAP